MPKRKVSNQPDPSSNQLARTLRDVASLEQTPNPLLNLRCNVCPLFSLPCEYRDEEGGKPTNSLCPIMQMLIPQGQNALAKIDAQLENTSTLLHTMMVSEMLKYFQTGEYTRSVPELAKSVQGLMNTRQGFLRVAIEAMRDPDIYQVFVVDGNTNGTPKTQLSHHLEKLPELDKKRALKQILDTHELLHGVEVTDV
jgi:hypothetical protein